MKWFLLLSACVPPVPAAEGPDIEWHKWGSPKERDMEDPRQRRGLDMERDMEGDMEGVVGGDMKTDGEMKAIDMKDASAISIIASQEQASILRTEPTETSTASTGPKERGTEPEQLEPERPESERPESFLAAEPESVAESVAESAAESPESLAAGSFSSAAFTPAHLRSLRARAGALFAHGWRAYRTVFPADEVRPLSCRALGPDRTDAFNLRNDAMGNVASTALDNLDTLILMRQWHELAFVLRHLESHQHHYFAQNATVQVFEAAIRWLGGLLSAHLLLSEIPEVQAVFPAYNGFLLHMAHDLGRRLLPAYNTPSGIPLARINLAGHAVPPALNAETCTAGAATPVLEMTLLSRLTGDGRFERRAARAFWALWRARSRAGLVPSAVDPHRGAWLNAATGVGASVDSFYEHALKGAIVFGDARLMDVFARSYEALSAHSAQSVSGAAAYFALADTGSGAVAAPWIDSLGAFWPGLQVLAGRLSDAVASHVVYMKIWNTFDVLPERWIFAAPPTGRSGEPVRSVQSAVPLEWYPLRPELIESTYYLYRATRDAMYLEMGVRFLEAFETRFKARCGFAGVQDVRTGERQDRMETFVLGESLKYLALLFDEAAFLHAAGMPGNWVFSTEAHPLWYTEGLGRRHAARFARREKAKRKDGKSGMMKINDIDGKSGKMEDIEHIEHTEDIDYIDYIEDSEDFGDSTVFSSLWARLRSKDADAVPEARAAPRLPFGPGIPPVSSLLDTCEVRPQQFRPHRGPLASSAYTRWPHLFLADARFRTTLVRPDYLGPQRSFELGASFLATHALGSPLQCAREPTSSELDVILDSLRRPEDYAMYVVRRPRPDHAFAKGDYVMPQLSGRLLLECVSAGSVDWANRRVSRAFVRARRPEMWASAAADVCRVAKLNGVAVARNSTVWMERRHAETQSGVFTVACNGRIFIEGKYLDNVRVY